MQDWRSSTYPNIPTAEEAMAKRMSKKVARNLKMKDGNKPRRMTRRKRSLEALRASIRDVLEIFGDERVWREVLRTLTSAKKEEERVLEAIFSSLDKMTTLLVNEDEEECMDGVPGKVTLTRQDVADLRMMALVARAKKPKETEH